MLPDPTRRVTLCSCCSFEMERLLACPICPCYNFRISRELRDPSNTTLLVQKAMRAKDVSGMEEQAWDIREMCSQMGH